MLRQSQGLFCFSAALTAGSWGGWTQLELLTQANQRDILCHVTSCTEIKSRVKKEEGGDVWIHGVCLPNELLCGMSPAFLGVAEVVWESLVLLCVRTQLLLELVNWFYSIHEFSHFYFSNSPLYPRKWTSGCVVLHCLTGLNHHKVFQEIIWWKHLSEKGISNTATAPKYTFLHPSVLFVAPALVVLEIKPQIPLVVVHMVE